jgi:TrmH family RNA methyltransferase
VISSRSNQKLKAIRRIRRSKGPQALLEGPNLVGEALAAGVLLDIVVATPEFLGSSPIAASLARRAITLLEVSAEVLASLAEADTPQGVLAVAELPRGGEASLLPRQDGVYVFLDHLQDPGNLGAIARAAEACGVAGLALSAGCVHPNHPRALRASAGSLLRLAVAVEVEVEALHRHLSPVAPLWVGLQPRGGQDLYETPLSRPLVLALGAEGAGLSAAILERSPLHLTIPIAEPVESLNVAVAASVVLFELLRRRRAAAGTAREERSRP